MRNPKNILRHEMIGMECNVVKSLNSKHVGIKGMIEDETLKTFVIDGKRVFKKGSTFRIRFGNHVIDVDGNYLMSRPEDRIKKKIKRW